MLQSVARSPISTRARSGASAGSSIKVAVPRVQSQRAVVCNAAADEQLAAPVPRRAVLLGMGAALAAINAGSVKRAVAEEMNNLQPAESIAPVIHDDFVDQQAYITGNLTKSLYAPDCRFISPDENIQGVENFAKKLEKLYDPKNSQAELIDMKVLNSTAVQLQWRLQGTLLQGGRQIKPITGTTTYELDPATSLITKVVETRNLV